MSFDSNAFLTALHACGIPYKTDVAMQAYTTFRIGGCVRYAVFPETPEQLCDVIRLCRAQALPCALVGCGSNLLWEDDCFDGCVIITTAMREISVCGSRLTAAAGASLSAVTLAARDAALAGVAFAYGIPGSVGGAVYMNAGAYGGEIGDVIASVTVYDPETDQIETVSREDCSFGYRTSRFQDTRTVILSAEFVLAPGCVSEIRAEMEDILSRRRDKQPLNYPSSGSAFKRYPGYYTAKLIDDAGLKGYSVGGAQVSEKHAGFIINRDRATAADVHALVAHVRDTIYQQNDIQIETEIRLRGDCLLL